MSDANQSPLWTVEQGTADEQDIKRQVDSASEVPEPSRKPPSDPIDAAGSIPAPAAGGEPKLEPEAKDPAAVLLGRRGGLKGGHARAKSLTAEQRKKAAQKAAEARWGKNWNRS